MITLYTADTPNGHKVAIFLEEAGVPHRIVTVDLAAGEQHRPEFLAISPNNKIPAVVDDETGQSVFESGAILIELADKVGRFIPQDAAGRSVVLQWLFMQVGSVGPMLGQLWWFRHASGTPNPQALERYTKEVLRIYGVVERQLAAVPYIGGEDYTIADIAMFPWLRSHDKLGITIDDFPHLKAWLARVAARPGVQRGLRALHEAH
ncbi:glutathione S-transferase family protein [Crenobacter cavernae]|uniref:Glutathione S-transferase n=1 Tax=Crenobacter cavernae TaxID=2290923 RepID=A0ABY0F9R0_9NEIS|nr:glutathione binding-like protein [Crenobacter cavernae]RXZ42213.1 glutathione S-transferase [Crenobacter cavernae]